MYYIVSGRSLGKGANMPSFYLHERTALMALADVGERAELALGALGPDVLYFNMGLRALGKRLHGERTGEFLLTLMRECASSAAGRAYALGFVSHYAADAVFHPFVYALSMTGQGYSALRHMAAERALDAWLRNLSHVPRLGAPEAGVLDEIAGLLWRALDSWLPGAAQQGEVRQALKRSTSGALDLRGMPTSVRVDCDGGQQQLTPERMQAFALRGWRDLWTGALSCDGPFELLGEALRRTSALAEATCAFWRGELGQMQLMERLGGKSYLTGQDWRDTRAPEPHELKRLRRWRRALTGRARARK